MVKKFTISGHHPELLQCDSHLIGK